MAIEAILMFMHGFAWEHLIFMLFLSISMKKTTVFTIIFWKIIA